MKIKWIIIYLSLCLLLFGNVAFAGGSNLSLAAGSRSISLNGLYIAGPNGIQNSISNPAGLTYLMGYGIEIFAIDRAEQQKFDSQSAGLFTSFRNDNVGVGGGVFGNILVNTIISLSYNPVIGYDVSWPFAMLRKNANTTSVLALDLFNQITINSITPSIAVKLGELSLGASANIYRVENNLSFPLGNEQWFNGVGLAAYQVNYQQNGWAYGFSFGAIANLSEKIKAGISLRSGFNTTLKGTAKSQYFQEIDSTSNISDISSKLEMPWTLGVGIIYSINNNWNINIDAVYSLWNMIQGNFLIKFANPVWQNRLTQKDSVTGIIGNNFPLKFKNSIDIGFGIEYTQTEGFIYRVGYRFSQTPNSSDTYSMLFPIVNQHWFSAGFGYKEENLTIDASLLYMLGISNEITKPGEPIASGKYNSNAFIPSISILYNF